MQEKSSKECRISLIVPFRDEVDLLQRCVSGLMRHFDRISFDLILVDNGSINDETFLFLESLDHQKIRILHYDKPFNYSAINNFAAREAKGAYLVFLNSDTEVISAGWLDSMLGLAERPDVGAVGARLLYPDDTIQHAGVMLGPNLAVHAFSGFSQDDPLFVEHGSKVREWSAVTAACMMTRRDVFLEMGGFDEVNFPIAYNDVDYCLRLRKERGLKTMWSPDATLYHYESATRGSDILAPFLNQKRRNGFRRERDSFRKKWAQEIDTDPFYDARFLRKREGIASFLYRR